MKRLIFLCALIVLITITYCTVAGLSSTINVLVEDWTGYAEGSYCMTFEIYDPDGGSPTYIRDNVPVTITTGGYMSVMLESIPGEVFDDGSGSDDNVRNVRYFFCGDSTPVGETTTTSKKEKSSAIVFEEEVSLAMPKPICDTNGDTIFCIPRGDMMSSMYQIQKIANERIKELEQRLEILEEKIANMK